MLPRIAHLRIAAVSAVAIALLVGACGDNFPPGSAVDSRPTEIDAARPDAPGPDAPPQTSGCTVTPGDARKLLTGTVLTPTGVVTNGQVSIDAGGMITCVGAACAAGGETRIDCPTGVISPGLINTHDHLTFTQNNPYNDTGERYEHRHDWRTGRRNHTEINAQGGASADQIRWGELRFVLGGATSIVGSGGQPGLLRNLDSSTNQGGLGQAPVQFETFPLDDTSGTQRTDNCNYGANPDTAATIASLMAYEPHVAEGIDRVSRNEFQCISSTTYDTVPPGVSNDLIAPQTAIIHGVGLTPFDYGVMAAEGTALIWSPRSNITLYGDTALVTVAARMGVEIALGTDWTPTGSMNLLRELRCAADVNATYYDDFFTDQQLWQMVTSNAASITATDDVIGSLAVGKIADIAIFDGSVNSSYRAVIGAEPKDVLLVLRGGTPLYGSALVIEAMAPSSCDELDVCGAAKRVCLMTEVGKSYAQLMTGAGSAYPDFFCGIPAGEPTCTPRRPAAIDSVEGSTRYTGVPSATDTDGDGIDDSADNCPSVFNPIRPVDGGTQGNFDSDSLGDACDPCPANANTTTCTAVDPNDRDNDGIANGIDNCPDHANSDQADADTDGKGDLCDACPNTPNPGLQGCPATIYSIKNRGAAGAVPLGQLVTVSNALVTGEGSNGFFVQVKDGDAGYQGADFSGMFVFTGSASPFLGALAVGNRVTITGVVTDFQGQIELDAVSDVTVTDPAVEAAPVPVAATAAELNVGGARAAALESVLVVTPPASISAVNAGFGEFTASVQGGGSLIVDDYLFLLPSPMVNQTFASMTGIIALRNGASKLEPRSLADLPSGAAVLAGFGPALSFIDEGQVMAPTAPVPLAVTLSAPAIVDTFVAITSDTPSALTVVGGGATVLAGQTTAVVLVNGLAAAAAVNLTASLDAVSLNAVVRVVGSAELPTLVTLAPASATIPPGGMVSLTATLNMPARAGGTAITLAVTPNNAGTIPASLTIPAGQLSATFTYVDGGTAASASVSATLGATTLSATITINAGSPQLVINEVDYDMPINPDAAEFVEIYNPSTDAVSLADYMLVFVNGSTPPSVYRTLALGPAGTLPGNGYLLVGAAAVTGGGIKFTPPVGSGNDQWPATDAIQNGAPDGIILVNTATTTVVDKLSYEGAVSITLTGPLASFGTVDLVEMTATPVTDAASPGSLARLPNGADTDNASVDWALASATTAGAENAP